MGVGMLVRKERIAIVVMVGVGLCMLGAIQSGAAPRYSAIYG